jgi:tetratricopeptide (TPR) repeat protein
MMPGSRPSPETFAQAVAAYHKGQLVDAERLFGAILDADSGHFDAANLLAIVQFLRGLHVEAVASFDKALAIRPHDVEALCNRGIVLKEMKRFDAALASFDRTLAIQPVDVDALYNRGVILYELKHFEAALSSFARILAIRPDHADALNSRGNALKALGQPELALASYDNALAARPDFAEALINRGDVLRELKRHGDAVASFECALAIRPEHAEALNGRGAALQALRRYAEALASHDRALAVDPGYAQAHNNRGTALVALKRPHEALASYDRALALKPDYAQALNNRGNALKELKRHDEALASYDHALSLRPNDAETYNNRGNALIKLNGPEAALASYDTALALRPDYAEAFNNRGNALMSLKRPAEALANYDQALALNPDNPEALNNRGHAFMCLMQPAEALASYDQALALKPDYADARLGKSFCLLLQGDFARGWRDYEFRWDTEQMQPGKRNFAQPLWLGDQDVRGTTILLHGEQGFGDTLQFCRLAKRVAQRGAAVVLEVPAELASLIASLDRAVAVIATGDALPPFDYHCPLVSLPLALRVTLETIPAENSYLSAPEAKARAWRERLGERGGPGAKPRVGLVWAGNPRLGVLDANRIDRQRSLAFDQLAPLFEATDYEFYSLQKGSDAAAQLRRSPLGARVIDWSDALADFADTAALVANLDLVITVDTAVAHLAGALGKPFWLLNRFNTCWRWLRDRQDSPWYPTARIFRQPTYGDWASVIDTAAAELRRWREGAR